MGQEKERLFYFIIDEYIHSLTDLEQIQTVTSIINRFSSLPADKKQVFIEDVFERLIETDAKIHVFTFFKEMNSFYNNVTNQLKQISKQSEEMLCETFGHEFGTWEEMKYPNFQQEGFYGMEDFYCGDQIEIVDRIMWYRTCKNCGLVQVSEVMPKGFKPKEKQK